MSIENIKHTIAIPAYHLLPQELGLTDPLLASSQALSERNDATQAEAEKDALRAQCGDKVCELLDKLGVLLPTDTLTVEVSLASLLCDLYRQGNPAPEAPLAARKYFERLDKMFQQFTEKGIVLNEAFRIAVKKTLSDDERWKQLQILGRATTKEDRLHVMMTTKIVPQIGVIMEAVMDLFPEESDIEPKQVALEGELLDGVH